MEQFNEHEFVLWAYSNGYASLEDYLAVLEVMNG